jgi:hypothetical protein
MEGRVDNTYYDRIMREQEAVNRFLNNFFGARREIFGTMFLDSVELDIPEDEIPEYVPAERGF